MGAFLKWSMQYTTQEAFWLVVWNVFHFSIHLGMSSSQLTNSYFFGGVGLNHQAAFV